MTTIWEVAQNTSNKSEPLPKCFIIIMVNKQDFLQVFQGSGIGKIEDNLTSDDPLSYTTTIMIPCRPVKLSERLLTRKNPLHSFLWSPGPQSLDRQTGEQFILKLSSEDNRRRGMTITFLHGCLLLSLLNSPKEHILLLFLETTNWGGLHKHLASSPDRSQVISQPPFATGQSQACSGMMTHG